MQPLLPPPKKDLMDFSTILIRLTAAALLGAVIGIERNMHGRPAGVRTHLLVSLGSALFMLLSILIPTLYPASGPGGTFYSDPARIAAQIVTGMGFLGAGVIIKDGLSIRGLTTAATLWATAAIGMACGAGIFILAGVAAAIALLGLTLFPILERAYKKDFYYILRISFKSDAPLDEILQLVRETQPFYKYDYERNFETGTTKLKLRISIQREKNAPLLMSQLSDKLESSDWPILTIQWYDP